MILMKNLLFICGVVLLVACAQQENDPNFISADPDECTRIQFLCVEGTEPFFNESGCGCGPVTAMDSGRAYVNNDPALCETLRFTCKPGEEAFFDETGCGCQMQRETDCEPEQRNAEICAMDYNPVCGWNDPEKIQCIRYPCAQTYSNSCEACKNPDVKTWTRGECPSG